MEEEYQLDLNSNEMCRNCLARNCQLKSLFRCDIVDGDIWSIPKIYQNITSISIAENDQFPQNICTKCEAAMFEAFTFKQKSIKSHNLLRKVLNISQEEIQPFSIERRSQSTQTSVPNDDESVAAVKNEINKNIFEWEFENDAVEVEDRELDDLSLLDEQDNEREEMEEEVEQEEDEIEEESDSWEFIYVDSVKTEDDPQVEPTSKENEDLHMDSETQDEPVPNSIKTTDCNYCGEKKALRDVAVHLKQHTRILPYLLDSIEFFRCSRCLMIFPFFENLVEHMNSDKLCEFSVELINEDACTDYQYLINDPIRLYSTSKSADTNLFSCSLCCFDFEDLSLFRKHFKDTHLSSSVCNPEYLRTELTHACGICGDPFRTLQDALHHVYFHQAKYPCFFNDCQQSFTSFSSLYIHFTRDHPDIVDAECPHCTYIAKNKDDLIQHQRNLCTARNFKCKFCGKRFFKRSTLNMHIRTHTNERKYVCSICAKAFLQSNDLANHIRTHTLERPFKCFQCDKRFKTVGQRIGHMATHTTENNFECDICHKNFKSARILHGHKKIHGERQFNCEMCDKKFNRKYHLTLHMKRHEKGKSENK